jgi:hypothetical protein
LVAFRNCGKWAASLETIRCKRSPGKKRDAESLAFLQHILGAPVCEIEAILDRDNARNLPRAMQLIDIEVAHPDVANLSFSLEIDERTDGIFQGHARIDGMKLIEIDSFQS